MTQSSLHNLHKVLSHGERDLQVSGLTNFPAANWRGAILYYLEGVWGNIETVMYLPKISFGGITLRLDGSEQFYLAYGRPLDEPPVLLAGRELVSTNASADVEVALARFVKNDEIGRLTINFTDTALFKLWKKEDGGYGCFATGVPKSL